MTEQGNPGTLEPISIHGNVLYIGAKRFIARGLVYQPESGPIRSPLRDERIDELKRDVGLFRELGINALRVYRIELDQAFQLCMQELADAGIYVVADLSEPTCCISRLNLRESYTADLLALYCAKIDVLSSYPNVLGVCAANMIVNGPDTADLDAPNVIRALIRDLKIHMRMMNENHGNRVLPLGVCDTEYAALSTQSYNDLASPSEPDSAIDFYMLVTYDNVRGANSDWKILASHFSHARKPLLVGEFGSNIVRPRPFDEIDVLYSDELIPQFSGGFVYEFDEGVNGYGLVKQKNGDIEKLPDFQSLKTKLQENAVTCITSRNDQDQSQ